MNKADRVTVQPFNPTKSGFPSTFSNLRTFVWLRWRLRFNQLQNGSALGKVLAAVLLLSLALSCAGLLITGMALGAFAPRLIPQEFYFLFWDGFTATFCVLWAASMATDLQRSDAITFDRILHLPVSFPQAFFINYISSLMNITFLSLCAFGSGFLFGSCFSVGPRAVWISIPFVAFLIAITALTYHLQGWLAALMSNPRRRQMIMIFVPLAIVFVSQVPAFLATRFTTNQAKRTQVVPDLAPPVVVSPQNLPTENADSEPLNSLPSDQAIDSTTREQVAIADEVRRRSELKSAEREANREAWLARIRLMNLWFPPLWLAGGVESIMEGSPHVLWITGALLLVGFVSLRRNYQQTLRYYKGETDSRASVLKKNIPAAHSHARDAKARNVQLIEWRVPYLSEETSAVITMTLQSMTRAPEVKLYVLLPLMVPFVLFGLLQTWRLPDIDELKSAIIVGFTAASLFITSGMLGNCFAFDRSGFRAFVLSPLRRERILLGRNLATIPFLLLQTILLAVAVGVYFGMAIDKLAASILLSASILPLYCLLTNMMSILTPFPLAAGSIQPKQFDLVPVLCSVLLSMLMPAITLLALLPLGIEWGIELWMPRISAIPIAFLLSIAWVFASIALYRWLLPWEGRLLAEREKELLRIVTSRVE